MKAKTKNVWLLVFSLALPLLVGFLGSVFVRSNIIAWLVCLEKPVFSPPNWLFIPIWTILLVLMGLAFYLILRDGKNSRYFEKAIIFFGAQLILILYWPLLFFYVYSPFFAFIDIFLLLIIVIFNFYYFYKIKKTAAYLLLPQVIWVTFATVLNYFVCLLNY